MKVVVKTNHNGVFASKDFVMDDRLKVSEIITELQEKQQTINKSISKKILAPPTKMTGIKTSPLSNKKEKAANVREREKVEKNRQS